LKHEFKFPEGDYKVGDTIPLSIFKEGDLVNATGTTRGMGFQGTIKRHNFSRGPETHGHDHHRAPGSIGAMGMSWVQKNKRMAGHMGDVTRTIRNLKVVAIDEKANLIAISGAVPGANQSFIKIKHISKHSYDESGN
jgi:large subunit ribosomal protein L3